MSMIHERMYQGSADLGAMSDLANAFPANNLHTADLPYRFSSWTLDRPDNARLWEDESGRLLAWAVLQTPFWTIDYVIHPDADSSLQKTLLGWVDAQAQAVVGTPYGRPAWFIPVFSDYLERIHAVESAGFVSQANVGENSWTKVLLARPSRLKIENWGIPEGFIIRSLQGRDEAVLYAFLHRAVFESTNMTIDWRLRTLLQPSYHPDLDLVAVAPDGRLAAFCICWLNKISSGEVTGQIEPLGVGEPFRELGLGKAILAEGLRRLEQLGAERILVETDNYRGPALSLYEAAGFHVERQVLVFRKDYEV
ncbi:MAG: GNAT family N-acetyltransferase [Anaerolineaceae bacterium]|nr:GNAT family N-acetyltransferase [Anaerolineaceae bacterium]